MPQEWEHAVKVIKAALKRKGRSDEDAEREAYAIATKHFEKKYGVSPRKLHSLRARQ